MPMVYSFIKHLDHRRGLALGRPQPCRVKVGPEKCRGGGSTQKNLGKEVEGCSQWREQHIESSKEEETLEGSGPAGLVS